MPDRTVRAASAGAGAMCVAAGGLTLVAVANPALLDTWSADTARAMDIAAHHRGAWLFTTWALAAGFAASVPAMTVLARVVGSAWASTAAAVHVVGAALLAVTTVFGLTVTRPLADVLTLAPDILAGKVRGRVVLEVG